MKNRIILTIVLITTLTTLCYAQQDTLRIATYNILRFPSENGAGRVDDFRRIIDAIDPDILVVQELESQSGMLTFLNDVMNHNSNEYEAAPFTTTPDFLNNSLFYKRDDIILFGVNEIAGSPRDITEYVLSAFGQDLTVFSVHFEAGSSTEDLNGRLGQATIIRNYINSLGAGNNSILAGDYNMRASTEAAYIKLTESQNNNNGRLFDPINKPGTWNNSSFFALEHTQSTRTTSFGSGSTGGMDDRFDQMLVTDALLQAGGVMILANSYKAYGNDGNHFNEAINQGTNLAVPDSIADALHQASDHLPVVASLVFGSPSSVAAADELPARFDLKQNYPNPFNPTTTIEFDLQADGDVTLTVYDLQGRELFVLLQGFRNNGRHKITFNGSGLASGLYLYELKQADRRQVKKMLLLK